MAIVFMLVNYTPGDQSIGITKKISAQIRAFSNLGDQVYYTGYTNDGVAVFDKDGVIQLHKKHRIKNRTVLGMLRYNLLLKCADEFVRTSRIQFDLCYGRISAPTHRYISFLNRLHKAGTKVILESLSYFPGVKPKKLKSRYIAFLLQKKKNQLGSVVDKIISEGYVESFYGIPTEKGLIGVDVQSLPKHHYLGSKEELNLISVATEREYHAYDRLLKSFYAYKKHNGTKRVKIHLVGNLFESTKKLIVQYGLESDVILYGKLFGDELYRVYNQCNVGIGPLGQHRIGGKKDTGLKTKEYLGIGIPYFYAGTEEDLPEGYPYVLQFPSDESAISFDEIWKFHESYRDDPNVADNMRKTAMDLFSWDRIMEKAIIIGE